MPFAMVHLRLRPISMTAAAIVAGLCPSCLAPEPDRSDARIAAPMIGGMISALLLTMLVLPAVYLGNGGTSKVTNVSAIGLTK